MQIYVGRTSTETDALQQLGGDAVTSLRHLPHNPLRIFDLSPLFSNPQQTHRTDYCEIPGHGVTPGKTVVDDQQTARVFGCQSNRFDLPWSKARGEEGIVHCRRTYLQPARLQGCRNMIPVDIAARQTFCPYSWWQPYDAEESFQ